MVSSKLFLYCGVRELFQSGKCPANFSKFLENVENFETSGKLFKYCGVGQTFLTLWRPATFEDSCAKTTRSHVALHAHNSGAESGRKLFKSSKDSASFLVCTQKNFFACGVWIFCERCHKWRAFRSPWPTSAGPEPKPLDGSISLKFLLETRQQSEFFDTLDDLIGFEPLNSLAQSLEELWHW